MYGNIFSQFMENRWKYTYLSHSWILRDFSYGRCITPSILVLLAICFNQPLKKIYINANTFMKKWYFNSKLMKQLKFWKPKVYIIRWCSRINVTWYFWCCYPTWALGMEYQIPGFYEIGFYDFISIFFVIQIDITWM